MIFVLVTSTIILAYAGLIGVITAGWWKQKTWEGNNAKSNVKVSVVVAVRNEAGTIGSLLRSIQQQDYPPELLEIIIVDDHSTDDTANILKEINESTGALPTLQIVTLNRDDGFGKKAALTLGIQSSSGELIVITDADCTAGPSWISTIASFYSHHQPMMITGPVQMIDDGSLFGKFQSLEFMSLISVAAGSCGAGFPMLANGANMAFTRMAFESCGGYSDHIKFPSGDDMFLMMSIKKKFGARSIRFLKSEDAIVKTTAIKGMKPFLQQRMRWVSKSRGYTDPVLIASSILVYLTNTIVLVYAISALLFPEYFKLFILFYLVKLIIDLPLMLSFAGFQKSRSLLWWFPVMELLNAFYTFSIGIIGNSMKYNWKGRK